MDLQINFDMGAGLARVRLSGHMDLEAIQQAFGQFLAHPEFERGMDAVWDLRETTVFMPPGDPSRLVEHVRSRRSQRGSCYRLAVLARTGEQWSLARVFQSVAASLPVEFAVFGDAPAANQWMRCRRRLEEQQDRDEAPVIQAFHGLSRAFSPQGT